MTFLYVQWPPFSKDFHMVSKEHLCVVALRWLSSWKYIYIYFAEETYHFLRNWWRPKTELNLIYVAGNSKCHSAPIMYETFYARLDLLNKDC